MYYWWLTLMVRYEVISVVQKYDTIYTKEFVTIIKIYHQSSHPLPSFKSCRHHSKVPFAHTTYPYATLLFGSVIPLCETIFHSSTCNQLLLPGPPYVIQYHLALFPFLYTLIHDHGISSVLLFVYPCKPAEFHWKLLCPPPAAQRCTVQRTNGLWKYSTAH